MTKHQLMQDIAATEIGQLKDQIWPPPTSAKSAGWTTKSNSGGLSSWRGGGRNKKQLTYTGKLLY